MLSVVFWTAAIALFAGFSFVILIGAPYLPTKNQQIKAALDLLDLKPGQTMLELGSGDGRVARAAARRGWHVVGYEANPLLALYSRLSTWRWRDQVRINLGNYWTAKWPPADAVYVFLLDRYMEKLDKKIAHELKGRPVKLVSFAFRIPGKKPTAKRRGVYLYSYH